MIPCEVCEKPIDAVTTAFIVTEFGPLGTVSLRYALCSAWCLGEHVDRIEQGEVADINLTEGGAP